VVTPSRQIRRSVVSPTPSTGMKLFSMRIPDRGDARAKPDGRRRRVLRPIPPERRLSITGPNRPYPCAAATPSLLPLPTSKPDSTPDFAGVEPRYNCAPGQDLPVIADEDPTVATRMEWD